MWDVVLPAAIGAASSLAVWGVKTLVEARGRNLAHRQEWAAEVLDGGAHRTIESINDSTAPRAPEMMSLLRAIPAPKSLANIATHGELASAHYAVRREIGRLYTLRLEENSRKQYFSSKVDGAIDGFEQRLIRWSHGRGSAKRIFAGKR